jgi:cytochrome c peroxidase
MALRPGNVAAGPVRPTAKDKGAVDTHTVAGRAVLRVGKLLRGDHQRNELDDCGKGRVAANEEIDPALEPELASLPAGSSRQLWRCGPEAGRTSGSPSWQAEVGPSGAFLSADELCVCRRLSILERCVASNYLDGAIANWRGRPWKRSRSRWGVGAGWKGAALTGRKAGPGGWPRLRRRSAVAVPLVGRPVVPLGLLMSATVLVLPALAAAQSAAFGTAAATAQSALPVEPIVPIPLSLSLDPGRLSLGERLFKDKRLAGDDSRSCGSCHPLDKGAMDGLPRSLARDGHPRLRNTPTLFNVGFNAAFNWDGAARTLEDHADVLITNPEVMGANWPSLLEKLKADSGYRSAFARAFPDGLTRENVLSALATFERSLITPNSRFDRFLRGEREVLSAEERRGYELFKSYGCIACHQGVNVGGNLFQKFGVFEDPNVGRATGDALDQGRYRLTKIDRDYRVFRVPSLRNVAITAPYFHDGRAPTLEGAVDTMARVQLGRTVGKPDLAAIVRFLHTLTGEFRGRPLAVSGVAGK